MSDPNDNWEPGKTFTPKGKDPSIKLPGPWNVDPADRARWIYSWTGLEFPFEFDICTDEGWTQWMELQEMTKAVWLSVQRMRIETPHLLTQKLPWAPKSDEDALEFRHELRLLVTVKSNQICRSQYPGCPEAKVLHFICYFQPELVSGFLPGARKRIKEPTDAGPEIELIEGLSRSVTKAGIDAHDLMKKAIRAGKGYKKREAAMFANRSQEQPTQSAYHGDLPAALLEEWIPLMLWRCRKKPSLIFDRLSAYHPNLFNRDTSIDIHKDNIRSHLKKLQLKE